METVEIIYLLILIVMFQAYQIWRLQREYEQVVDLVIGLHLGNIDITEVEDDEY